MDAFGLLAQGIQDTLFNYPVGVYNLVQQRQARQDEADWQWRQWDYNTALNQLQMNREDNAIQRRVADLKAAGLSPTLAAGSAAGSSGGSILSSSNPSTVPQARFSIGQMMDYAQALNNMEYQQAQLDLLQTEKEKASWDLNYYKKNGLPTNATGIVKEIVTGIGAIASALGQNGMTTNQVMEKVEDLVKGVIPSIQTPQEYLESRREIKRQEKEKQKEEKERQNMAKNLMKGMKTAGRYAMNFDDLRDKWTNGRYNSNF